MRINIVDVTPPPPPMRLSEALVACVEKYLRENAEERTRRALEHELRMLLQRAEVTEIDVEVVNNAGALIDPSPTMTVWFLNPTTGKRLRPEDADEIIERIDAARER